MHKKSYISTCCNLGDICPGCGRAFVCGMEGENGCWCAGLPPAILPPVRGVGCFCPECLRKRIDRLPVRCDGSGEAG
ncbi:MAG: cysteine-rich CWC family protein [Betaproteobacteria bacterium]|nr:cysteine-rich CWC family protein [Betaproteobacteria bacterium]